MYSVDNYFLVLTIIPSQDVNFRGGWVIVICKLSCFKTSLSLKLLENEKLKKKGMRIENKMTD